MNLAKKIVVEGDERQSIELIWRFCIKLVFSSIYLKEVEYDNDEIM